MGYISQITLPDGNTHQIKPATTALSGVNLNTITGTGFYSVTNCTNSKFTSATLIVISYTSGYTTQIESNINNGAIAIRTNVNGNWGSWTELMVSIAATYDNNGNVTLAPSTSYADGDAVSY